MLEIWVRATASALIFGLFFVHTPSSKPIMLLPANLHESMLLNNYIELWD